MCFENLLLSLSPPQGVGINLHDPFELFRKNKSYTYNRRERSGEYYSLIIWNFSSWPHKIIIIKFCESVLQVGDVSWWMLPII